MSQGNTLLTRQVTVDLRMTFDTDLPAEDVAALLLLAVQQLHSPRLRAEADLVGARIMGTHRRSESLPRESDPS